MAESFDPYRKWLGIPPEDQPPNHYRLLGIAPFESDPDVIDNAATRQMTHVRAYQASKHAALSQRIMKELTVAKLCLLTPERKETYDVQLRARMPAEGKLSVASQLPASVQLPPEAARTPLPPFPRTTDIRWRLEEPASPEPTDMPPTFPPVPIPMPAGDATAAVPLVRQKPPAYLRARRKKNVLPALLIIGSLVVLIGGGAAAALLLSGQSLDRALDFQAAPAPVAPAPPRTE
jgi:hypothetical protein